jgi:hypothetical protein
MFSDLARNNQEIFSFKIRLHFPGLVWDKRLSRDTPFNRLNCNSRLGINHDIITAIDGRRWCFKFQHNCVWALHLTFTDALSIRCQTMWIMTFCTNWLAGFVSVQVAFFARLRALLTSLHHFRGRNCWDRFWNTDECIEVGQKVVIVSIYCLSVVTFHTFQEAVRVLAPMNEFKTVAAFKTLPRFVASGAARWTRKTLTCWIQKEAIGTYEIFITLHSQRSFSYREPIWRVPTRFVHLPEVVPYLHVQDGVFRKLGTSFIKLREISSGPVLEPAPRVLLFRVNNMVCALYSPAII